MVSTSVPKNRRLIGQTNAWVQAKAKMESRSFEDRLGKCFKVGKRVYLNFLVQRIAV